MKVRFIKTICQIVSIVSISVLFACSGMNDDHDIYLRNGEIQYLGRVDSVKLFPGNNRFMMRYWVSDSRAEVLKIYWDQKRDSLIVPIPPHSPADPMDILIGNVQNPIPEGTQILQMVTSDGDGLTSIMYERNVNVYGEAFASTIYQRAVSSAWYDSEEEELTITWLSPMSAKEVGVNISYFNVGGETVQKTLSVEELRSPTVLENIDVTKGASYRTAFLPEPLAIDTFFTNMSRITIRERSNVALGALTEVSDFFSSSSVPYTGDKAVDGNTTAAASRWVSDDSHKEHWLVIDFGEECEVNALETWNDSPTQANFSLQVEQDGEWVDVHTAVGNSLLHYYADFIPTTARRVRYYIPPYQSNRVRLFEIAIYQVKTY